MKNFNNQLITILKKLNQILKTIILLLIITFGLFVWNYPQEVAKWNDDFNNYKSKKDIVQQKIELQKQEIYLFEKQYRMNEMKRLYKN